MHQKIILVLIILNGDMICAATVADSWIRFAKAMKDSWIHCPNENGAWHCMKWSSLEVFDKMTKANVISLAEDVKLVRHRHHRILSPNSNLMMDKNALEQSSLSLESWSEHILGSILNLYHTHTLTIGKSPNEGRRRHRNNNMVPMMLLGATAFGIFVVPMGLQFLLIVCGKAILLSKMALLISSINGSSRVEHSGAAHHGHGFEYWNRDDVEQPRSRRM